MEGGALYLRPFIQHSESRCLNNPLSDYMKALHANAKRQYHPYTFFEIPQDCLHIHVSVDTDFTYTGYIKCVTCLSESPCDISTISQV